MSKFQIFLMHSSRFLMWSSFVISIHFLLIDYNPWKALIYFVLFVWNRILYKSYKLGEKTEVLLGEMEKELERKKQINALYGRD